jgi:NAD(P)-dependent dehydrogenase (short-subunit alcohol dehydrogenase family)
MNRPEVALVTGASRGIGRAIAVRLAAAGFNVAVVARTVVEGEAREHSSTVRERDDTPLPGSLEGTSREVEEHGAAALLIPGDLLDEGSIRAAAETTLAKWGRVDVLVNNGRYVGPGHMDLILDTPVELLRNHLEANAIAPVILAQAVIPGMIERGGGTIVNVTSLSAYSDPGLPAGAGGWGLGYGLSKGALQRIAGMLHTELGDRGIRAFNVQPGVVATERIAQDMAKFGFKPTGAPPEAIAAVVEWLARSGEADRFAGRTVEAQSLCFERGLLPGWDGPEPNTTEIRFDDAARLSAQAATGSRTVHAEDPAATNRVP